jgi:ribosome-associated translation inhibitor RaiA
MSEFDAYRNAVSARINALQQMLLSVVLTMARGTPNPAETLKQLRHHWLAEIENDEPYAATVNELSDRLDAMLAKHERRKN